MSKWIDADAFLKEYCEPYPHIYKAMSRAMAEAPSIDIVRCKECKYGRYREDYDEYECYSSGCGLVYDADFYCSDGEREGE